MTNKELELKRTHDALQRLAVAPAFKLKLGARSRGRYLYHAAIRCSVHQVRGSDINIAGTLRRAYCVWIRQTTCWAAASDSRSGSAQRCSTPLRLPVTRHRPSGLTSCQPREQPVSHCAQQLLDSSVRNCWQESLTRHGGGITLVGCQARRRWHVPQPHITVLGQRHQPAGAAARRCQLHHVLAVPCRASHSR